MNRTHLIVLRKTQYRESSIIVAGLTSNYGRVDVIVKGAKKLSSKTFPAVDLFRELDIEIKHHKKNLYSVYSADLVSNHDNIASFHLNYLAACDICSFVLKNSQPNLPSPELYEAIKNIFSILSQEKTEIPYPALIKLIYLDEHGFLPELTDADKEKTELLENLLQATMGKNKIPEITPEYWEQLRLWIESLCKFHELN